jgi:hypothetical protein
LAAIALAGLGQLSTPGFAEADEPIADEAQASATPEPQLPATAPEQVSGIRIAAEEPNSAPWLWTQRALFLLPRMVFNAVMAPPRLAAWAFDRYSVEQYFQRTFFNREGTIGAYPFVDYEAGFGATWGLVFTDEDHLPLGVQTKASARFGGRAGQTFQFEARTGPPVGGLVRLRVVGRYEHETRDQYFGIGNQDSGSIDDIIMPVAATEVAVKSRYRHQDVVASFDATFWPKDRLRLRLSSRFLARDYNPSGANADLVHPIEDIYLTDQLVGYQSGLRNFYSEVRGIIDLRRIVADYHNPPVYGAGWLISGSVGAAFGVSDAPSRHGRYSLDVRKYLSLYRGDRVLVLRTLLVGVFGDQDRIPFDALPFLGGRRFLRGYPSQRFRDLVSALATAEYQYPINHYVGGYLFVDTGRVFPQLRDLELADLRLGYGAGLDYRSPKGTLARLAVSSSIDGGIFFNLGFESTLDVTTR